MQAKRKEKLDYIICLLQKESLNRRQLQTHLGVTLGAVDDYTAYLSQEGLIYVDYWVRTLGKPTPYWRAGNRLSAPRPDALGQTEYLRRSKEKKLLPQPREQIELVESPFVPRRDLASSWF